MNISHKYLVNNCLSEKKKNFYGKLISRYEKAFKEYRNNNNKDCGFKKKVLSWLFNHKLEDRMTLCSVENKKYTNTIHEAYIYTKQSKNVKFSIGGDDSNDAEKYKLEMTTMDNNDYNENTNNKSDGNKKDFWAEQNAFLDNIVFYQCESPIDDINNYSNYFTLDSKILNDFGNFKTKCDELTDGKFLASPIMIKKEIQNKTFKFLELPNWISPDSNEINNQMQNCTCSYEDKNYCQIKNNFFSLTQIILALIEQALSIRYVLHYKSNNLNELLESTYLYDLFEKKELILEYLNKNNIEPKIFYTKFNIADINTKIFYDQNIENFIKEKKNYIDELDYYENISFPSIDKFCNDKDKIDSIDKESLFEELLKNNNKNSDFYKKVIDMSLFFPLNKLYTLDDFFFRSIFEKIYDYYGNKIVDDLTTNETKTEKQKKKKKKKKKNNINNDNDIKEEDNFENEKTNEINENNIDNEKEKEIIYNFVKSLINDNINKKLNEKIKNEIINSKKNKKEKGFFLYEPVKKKEKKKPNNKSKKKLNNKINKDKDKDNKNMSDIGNNNVNKNINNNESSNEDSNKNMIIISNKKESDNNNNKDNIEKKYSNLSASTNNSSIPSHINSFTLCSSNNSSTSSDSISYNNCNSINIVNEHQENNFFVIHQNPMMISYEKFKKLTEDIFTFSEDIESLLVIIRKIKMEIKLHFESIIKKIYHKNSKIEIYGSSTYQLDIESSDLDLSIASKSKIPLNSLVEYLYTNNYNGQYLNINPIYTASIPIIKLDIDFIKLNNYKINDLYKSLIENDYYKLCLKNNFYTNFNIIKVDISMNSINYKQMNFIRKGINNFPQIKPLIKILKKLLIIKGMNNSYKGGMSSYCLFLIIYSYIRMQCNFYTSNNNDFNYGSLLIGFLFHYVMCIDFKYTIINPCLSNPFIISSCPIETIPTIIEPTTMKNAGKNIYKIVDVVNAFNEIYRDVFVVIKEDNNNNENLVYKLFRKYLENKNSNK